MRRLNIVSVGLLLVSLPSSLDGAIVRWRAEDGGNGHWYEAVYVPGGITWSNARADAEAAGGYLATITSSAENVFVYNLAADDKFWIANWTGMFEGPWLGGYQEASGTEPFGGWHWITGESWSWLVTNDRNSVDDEGGNSGIDENRLQLFAKSTAWNDLPENGNPLSGSFVPVSYIVEFDSVPEPTTFAIWSALGGLGMMVAARRRRKAA